MDERAIARDGVTRRRTGHNCKLNRIRAHRAGERLGEPRVESPTVRLSDAIEQPGPVGFSRRTPTVSQVVSHLQRKRSMSRRTSAFSSEPVLSTAAQDEIQERGACIPFRGHRADAIFASAMGVAITGSQWQRLSASAFGGTLDQAPATEAQVASGQLDAGAGRSRRSASVHARRPERFAGRCRRAGLDQ